LLLHSFWRQLVPGKFAIKRNALVDMAVGALGPFSTENGS